MKHGIYLICMMLLLAACGKEGPVGPKGPVGVSYTWPPSSITGYMHLYDQFGDSIPGDSVQVKTYNGQYEFVVYSGARGFWQTRQMPPGNFDIGFTKPGFDSVHAFTDHAGGGEAKFIGDITMYQHPQAHFTDGILVVPARDGQNYTLNLTVHYTGADDPVKHRTPGFDIELYEVVGGKQYFMANSGWIQDKSVYVPGEARFSTIVNVNNTANRDTAVVQIKARVPLPDLSWFNYATQTSVPYPYPADSITITGIRKVL